MVSATLLVTPLRFLPYIDGQMPASYQGHRKTQERRVCARVPPRELVRSFRAGSAVRRAI
jgi:hypothetical protein